MPVINVNSISGINSVTAQSSNITFYNSSGGLGKIVADFSQSTPSASELVGVTTTASTTSGSTTVTLSGSGQAANISNGFSVAGRGITPGTTVSSGGGTVNIVLSQNAGVTTTTNALTFYTNSKALSPGSVGGMLCRAWVNFDGTNTNIRASYNVSSINDGGTGVCTVNFTTAMPDTNYTILGSGGNSAANNSVDVQAPTSVPTTSSFEGVYAYGGSSSPSDVIDYVFFAVFR
jgi:hypothetical protein